MLAGIPWDVLVLVVSMAGPRFVGAEYPWEVELGGKGEGSIDGNTGGYVGGKEEGFMGVEGMERGGSYFVEPKGEATDVEGQGLMDIDGFLMCLPEKISGDNSSVSEKSPPPYVVEGVGEW